MKAYYVWDTVLQNGVYLPVFKDSFATCTHGVGSNCPNTIVLKNSPYGEKWLNFGIRLFGARIPLIYFNNFIDSAYKVYRECPNYTHEVLSEDVYLLISYGEKHIELITKKNKDFTLEIIKKKECFTKIINR